MIGYAFERLDLGPAFRLEDGKEIYGQGIWAPSFRYSTSFQRESLRFQVFRASDPRGSLEAQSHRAGAARSLPVVCADCSLDSERIVAMSDFGGG
jgi:hypothetical protein